MDSEDDMHDANSVDDDYYSGDTAADYCSDDDCGDYEFMDHDFEDPHDIVAKHQQKNYVVLNEADICQRQEDDITTVSTILSIPRVAASILLCHYHWSVSNVHEAWFADEDRIRKTVGLLERPVQFSIAKLLTCGICFESYPLDRISTAACGHPFCSTCWKSYMRTSIDGGPGCLMLRCPDPSCSAAVGQDMISRLASDDDKGKYARYLLRSYIEDNRKVHLGYMSPCSLSLADIIYSRDKQKIRRIK